MVARARGESPYFRNFLVEEIALESKMMKSWSSRGTDTRKELLEDKEIRERLTQELMT